MSNTASQVLKPNCSLVGKSLIPAIIRVKAADAGDLQILPEFSRFKKDEPLESYSKPALIKELEKLTGESVKDVIILTGKEDSLENLRILAHESIILANSIGPKGQRLSGNAQIQANTVVAQGGSSKAAAEEPCTKQELFAMRQDLNELKSKSKDLQVDEALAYVRTLASRPKLTTPGVLLAAIEMLIDAANKANHKDSVLFSKSYAMCKKFEEHTDFCGLVVKLFGSQEDKKISSLISDWAKSKKYEDSSKEKTTVQHDVQVTSGSGYPIPGFGFQSPGFGFPYPGFFPGLCYNFGSFRPPLRGGGRGNRAPGVCFGCKEKGHFVANCPNVKKRKLEVN